MHYKKLRVIVRPWQPRNLPFAITQNELKTFIQTHAELFAEVLYLGWVRRIEKGKRVVKFRLATGSTRIEAKQKFKENTELGMDVWELAPPNIQSDHQRQSDFE